MEYRSVIETCRSLFEKKTRDYGTAWRILRLPSITDQIYIKAQRIRSIQEKGTQKVDDPIRDEFIGIINYCIIALIQIKLTDKDKLELSFEELQPLYESAVDETFQLLQNKNHDYGEAWREMRLSSITDQIITKSCRIATIEKNRGKTSVSEGIASELRDIVNYCAFALIKIAETREQS